MRFALDDDHSHGRGQGMITSQVELPPPPLEVPNINDGAAASVAAVPGARSPVFPVAYSYLQEGWESGGGGRRTISGRLRYEDEGHSWF